jgi:hypothetical protein
VILTALYAALTWLAIFTLAIYGISLYGAHLAKLRDQRAKDGVNWSMTA